MDYFAKYIFLELVLPLSFFIPVMLTFFVDWSWIPISSEDRDRGNSIELIKKNLFE